MMRITTIFFLIFLMLSGPLYPAHAEWKQADVPRVWTFPRDYGSHPEYRTEWWYFTGNLTDAAGHKYGYQLTFFRHGLVEKAKDPANPWSVRDIYLAHFAITDGEKKTFRYRDRISRKGPDLSSSSQAALDVHVLSWSASMKEGRIILKAKRDGMELSLQLKSLKPPVFHGQAGLSKKGPMPGQASYYYSLTDLATTGTLMVPGRKTPVTVKGTSWFDQEFGSNQLSKDQAGWDWFSLHLRDGRDLMVYFLRKKDGTLEAQSSGTLIEPDGRSRHLALGDIRIDVRNYWKSKKTGGNYPASWHIVIPSASIDLIISPIVADQELTDTVSSNITYWEGAVEGKDISRGKPVEVTGYVEMTGYAGTIGGVF
ncbi:MAG: lipocalin-like domain-containing protein [Syntrophorhabdus sp.]